jgi:1-acylglycerone phosphate reductase
VIQAFLPLLLESKGTIVNYTSVGASVTLPFQGIYNSSKSALAMLSDTLRLEIEPFDVKVIDLRSAVIKTNLIKNMQDTNNLLPKGSIYEPARDTLEKSLRQEQFVDVGMPVKDWAEATVKDLSKKSPTKVIWRGETAFLCWVGSILPQAGNRSRCPGKAFGQEVR